MAKRGPLSAAHKAAISAGLKRYHASKGSGSSGKAKTSLNVDTGKQISRGAAAAIMFGSAGARKKLASGKKARKRR